MTWVYQPLSVAVLIQSGVVVNATPAIAVASGINAEVLLPAGGYFSRRYFGVSYFGIYYTLGIEAEDATINATPGDAVADGAQASVSTDVVISATAGAAAADGTQAEVSTDVTISAIPGSAAADGVAAIVSTDVVLLAVPGDAVAEGVQADVSGETVVSAIPGDAAAEGIQASISGETIVGAAPGEAVADGVQALVSTDVVISATAGSAIADGLSALVAADTTISASPGNASAAGVTAAVTLGSGTRTALSFPSNGDSPASFIAMILNDSNLPPAAPLTIMWRYRPRQQTGFYIVCASAQGDGGFSGANYRIATPYPPTGGSGGEDHKWSIGDLGTDYYVDSNSNNTDVIKDGSWYAQAFLLETVGGDGVLKFYWDLLEDTGRIIEKTDSGSPIAHHANSPEIIFGDARWAALAERLSGEIRGFEIYTSLISTTHLVALSALESDAAVLDYCTANSISAPWFLNINPTAADITDKGGSGHDAEWVGTAASDYTLADDQTISATPASAVADGVSADILSAYVVSASPANAVADGVSASIVTSEESGGYFGRSYYGVSYFGIYFAPGAESSDVVIDAVPGGAVADGVQALVSVDVTILAEAGAAIADGALSTISTAVVLDALVGNAVADGVQALISTDVDISAVTGAALADGVLAIVSTDVVIATSIGDAIADGVQAVITLGAVVSASPGNAVADGSAATITTTQAPEELSFLGFSRRVGDVFTGVLWAEPDELAFTGVAIEASVGAAIADGVAASVLLGVTVFAEPASAIADGVQAQIQVDGVVFAEPANAAANGIDAVISVSVTIAASPSNAVADGAQAVVSTSVSIGTSVGAAVADGIAASVSADAVISASPAQAAASAAQATIGTAVTISTTPASASASGETAVVDTHITIQSLVGAASAGGILAQIFGPNVIPTSPGNAVADGVQGSVRSIPLGSGVGLVPTEPRRRGRQRTIPTPEEKIIIHGIVSMQEQGRDGIDIVGTILESDEQIFNARKRKALAILMMLS